jgi:glyoxylase-like metal-dependent hydrolase (beta-lactamase superfamily II)/rhodanese-related sulfurtransferase
MDHELILTPGLGNAAFLIAAGREAVVVDPPRDAWRVLAVAEARGWRITHVLETHVHNDYLSGALELRASTGAEILAPARGRFAFDHRGMDDGDAVELDGLRLTARATPGHTPEHLAWEVHDGDAADAGRPPAAVATGGSLLVGSAGRSDLLGPERTAELVAAQYRSLRSLATLPDATLVLPTHGAGSFCSAGPADAGRTTTIGRERATNPMLAARDEAAFRSAALDGLGPYPAYYASMAPLNRAGPAVVGRPDRAPILDAAGFRDAIREAHVIDGRRRDAFAAGHLPGSLNIELTESFASYVGWFVPFGAPVALVLPEPLDGALDEAVIQLFRIGYDRVIGALAGGTAAWEAAGGEILRYPVTTVGAVRADIATGGQPTMLDVRFPDEWRTEGAVAGAIEVAIGDLPHQADMLPRDVPITVMCKSGARASIAASYLDARGFDVRLVATGGAPDIAAVAPDTAAVAPDTTAGARDVAGPSR